MYSAVALSFAYIFYYIYNFDDVMQQRIKDYEEKTGKPISEYKPHNTVPEEFTTEYVYYLIYQ